MTATAVQVIGTMSLEAGGPTQSLSNLCLGLEALGTHAPIITIEDPSGLPPGSGAFPVIQAFKAAPPAFLKRSPALAAHLETLPCDLIHAHGIWWWTTVHARREAVRRGIPLVISPRGSLEPWCREQKRLKKTLAWHLWEGANFSAAAMLHATSQLEADSLRAIGLRQPIALVPNGQNFPARLNPERSGKRKALFMSRFHKKKGVDILLHAWALLRAATPDWELLLVGPDEGGYRKDMEALARALGIGDSVTFFDPVYGQGKWDLLAQADLFLLPSHSENFGNVVLEALSQGTPVLTTTGTPWRELGTRACGWCVPIHDFPQALGEAMAMGRQELAAMGNQGRDWVDTHFHARITSEQMLHAYQWILGTGDKPNLVI